MINRYLSRIRHALARRRFADDESERQAALLYATMAPIFVVTMILIPILPLIGAPWVVEIPVFSMLALETVVFLWVRQGKTRQASLALVFGGWLLTTFPAFIQGGIISPFVLFSITWVIVAGLLLETRMLILMLVLNIIEVSAFLAVTTFNLIPPVLGLATPLRYWNVMMLVMYVSATLIRMAMTNLRSALSKAQLVRFDLQQTNQELLNARQDMEQRVNERTMTLERRAHELEASSEVVRGIASIRDLEPLLDETTHLLSQQFDLYYSAIFLLDENRQVLVMRAGNSQIAQDMIQAGFSVPLETISIISTAVRTGKPYLAADVSRDLLYLPTAGLAETRSELALPLLVGKKALGVIDLQSSAAGVFTTQNLETMQTLANQIAIAIENAQLFGQNQQALDSLQRAYTSLGQEGWQRLLRTQHNLAYRAGAIGAPTQVTDGWRADMTAAMQAGEVVKTDPWTLAVPIKIRGQSNGVIRLRKPADTNAWSEDEIRLVVTLSDRLSNALESARLYEETRRRAERERLTGEITARMRASNDQKTILQIAAQELRSALQADHANLSVQAIPLQPAEVASAGSDLPPSPAQPAEPGGDE